MVKYRSERESNVGSLTSLNDSVSSFSKGFNWLIQAHNLWVWEDFQIIHRQTWSKELFVGVVESAFTASLNTSYPIRVQNSRLCFLTLMYCPISIQNQTIPFYVFKHDVRAVRKKERETEWENSSGRYTASGKQKTIASLPPVTYFTFKQQISFTQLISSHWLWSAVKRAFISEFSLSLLYSPFLFTCHYLFFILLCYEDLWTSHIENTWGRIHWTIKWWRRALELGMYPDLQWGAFLTC